MTFETVTYDVTGDTARITLNRPEKHNALNHQLMDDLEAAIDAASDDPNVAVVILAGAGRSFCAGYDLAGSYYTSPPAGPEVGWRRDDALAALADIERRYLKLWNCPKVTIAKVRGAALAAGCYLQLMCDISVCADTARLGHPVAGAGVTSMPLWQVAMPLKKARYLLMTGRTVDGATAERFDLVSMCVPEAELDSTVEDIARDCARYGPEAARIRKTAYNTALDIMGVGSAFRYHAHMNAMTRWGLSGDPYKR